MAPRIVALGGGHGLAANLRALRLVTADLVAVVGVSDNGGSSGRLRDEFNVIPPGDLRMALTALCADDDWGRLWSGTLQHRFPGDGPLSGHALGNLLITALWQREAGIVAGLDAVSQLLGAAGRVLPLALSPLDVAAEVEFADGRRQWVQGQVQVATTRAKVLDFKLDPKPTPACAESLAAVAAAELVVMGPGSWFTSVLSHLALPDMRAAIAGTRARRLLVANLCSQTGETEGFSPAEHLMVLERYYPEVRFDAILVDSGTADAELHATAATRGWPLRLADLADGENPHIHDPKKLAAAVRSYLESADFKEGA